MTDDMVKAFRAVVRFTEDDLYDLMPNLYSDNYKNANRMSLNNKEFNFSLVYPRMKGLKIICRFLLLVACLFYAKLKKKRIQEESPEARKSFKFWAGSLILKFAAGFLTTSFAVDTMLMILSIQNGPSVYDWLIIILDFMM
jgi:hypothetical protein